MADTTLMSIPGQVDPVPVAREITPRPDGRVDLIGLPKDQITALFAEAGLLDSLQHTKCTISSSGTQNYT